MGYRPISANPISDNRSGTFFFITTGQGILFPRVGSALSDIQAQTWRRLILAAEVNAITLSSSAQTFYTATDFFISRSTDVPADQPFDGTLERSLRLDRAIGSSRTGGYSGFSESISELTLINASGDYDSYTGTISVNGQTVRCSMGQTDDTGLVVAPYAMFEFLALLKAERFRIDRVRMTVEMRDPALAVINETVQQNIYGGAGELDGADDLSGKRKPYLDGVVFNITPVLVIPNELLYQINDGAVSAISSVKDGGEALTFAGNFANVAALRAAETTLGAGNYGTSLSDGYL